MKDDTSIVEKIIVASYQTVFGIMCAFPRIWTAAPNVSVCFLVSPPLPAAATDFVQLSPGTTVGHVKPTLVARQPPPLRGVEESLSNNVTSFNHHSWLPHEAVTWLPSSCNERRSLRHHASHGEKL